MEDGKFERMSGRSMPRILTNTNSLMAKGGKFRNCWRCNVEFNVFKDKVLLSKGSGRSCRWYHIECAKEVNLL